MRVENLDDGLRLESAWNEALNSSVAYFRALLSSSGSSAWKPVSVPPQGSAGPVRDPTKARPTALGRITASDVVVHRRNGKSGEVFRAVVDVDCGTDVNIDTFRVCLATPETRPQWDRMVEEAQLVDLIDTQTRVTKTSYKLGWPSSPRDAVTISKTLVDQNTLIDVSTSVPRSRHEPPYLRPAPPYVRADVSLLAWCIQLPSSRSRSAEPPIPEGKVRIQCFWCWNPKGTWAVGGAVPQHLPSVIVGLVDFVREGSEKVPVLLNYGEDVTIGSISYDPARVMLSAGYAVVNSEEGGSDGTRRQIEFGLSSTQGWDVQIQVKTQSGDDSTSSAFSSFVGQSPATLPGAAAPKRLVFRLVHAELQPQEELVRVKVTIERTALPSSGAGVRINGVPATIQRMESVSPLRNLLDGSPGASAMSLPTVDTSDLASRDGSVVGSDDDRRIRNGRPLAAQKSVASLIKRNYIYFTSLLQEPEPKWRPVAESKGVGVHQLNSIDKTLVVFRAEAVFVGVGVWDLFATIITPGTRLEWDKSYEDATLLEDVNELTDVWHFKSKPSWPVAARDSVLVRTTYKSPSSVHIFGFSTENTELFPVIPPCIDPNVIRTQIDLQGWSIEALSPNTTQVTLLEQSHPGGWSNKSSIPQVMMSTLSGLGEFAIKHGAPPVATRLGGAKAISSRWDGEKETFRYQYEAAEARRSRSSGTETSFMVTPVVTQEPDSDGGSDKSTPELGKGSIECELRCDPDKWSNTIIALVDPPPKRVSALKRHRLSPNGGGLWLSIEHDLTSLGSGVVTVTVRKGSASTSGKTALTVNGSKVKIDNQDLSENDVQQLKKKKRSRPSRVALDQPPVLGVLRKRQSNMSLQSTAQKSEQTSSLPASPSTSAFGRFYSPLARLVTVASESTRAAVVPMPSPTPSPATGSTAVDAAVRALGQLSRIHADRDGESTDPFGWQPVADRDGLKIERRIVGHVSDSVPVYRAGRIIEGFTAEEISGTVSAFRKDEYFEKPVRLQSYGYGITTSHIQAHAAFPFRDRSIVVATVVARVPDTPPPSPSVASHTPLTTIFHASSSSFDHATLGLDAAKYNPSVMPSANIILEGWILETIDPYSHEQYAIPSTRCMYVGAIDYGGNIPVSMNNMLNAGLPRTLLNIEQLLKTQGPPSRVHSPPMSVLVPDAAAQGPWALSSTEAYKLPIDQVNDGDDYVVTVTVQPPSTSSSRDAETLRPPLNHSDSKASLTSSRSTVIDLAEDIRRGKRDLIVADIDVGTEIIKGGCEIAIRAVSLPEAYHGSGSSSSDLPLEFSGDRLGLPFKCSAVSLAPSLLQSASLDPSTQTRHLLRVTLPTSGYEAPVNDPLTGKTAALPRPRWLLDLISDGAVVQIRLVARKIEPAAYMFEGTEVPVEDERKLPSSKFARDSAKVKLPQLVNRSTANSESLGKPLAVAREYLPEPPATPVEDPKADSDANSTVTTTPTNEPVKLPPESSAESSEESKPPPTPAPIGRYNFWKYAPLNRFSASAPASHENSPIKPLTNLPSITPKASPPSRKLTLIQEGKVASTTTAPTEAPRVPFLVRTAVPLPAVIIACLVCLLLGSLLRSLLSEADFVIYAPPGAAPAEGEAWRELKRLAEWRISLDKELIIAIAHRGQTIVVDAGASAPQ
ncbi:uncharacterized protein LOC62_02G003032 [Vanrija pseudolonga]|uniref:START domain-containing protein n=1 Tax=Vanrija pseudolonga TaxID=143232 RepID=A0AAF0Y7J4_9TREE|nr:hypothetical protein LOC62_02G003032 [Vanrija pseudolonga]